MDLTVHPQIKKMKEELSQLIFEYNDLQFHTCPNIEHEYLVKFGVLEYEVYKKEVELNRLKRKYQLMQIKVNNEEKIDVDLIENQLKKEFRDYEKSLTKQMDELKKMTANTDSKKLSEKDSQKIKKLYRQCILKLHPDLASELTEENKILFFEINQAYKAGDLKTMESLAALVNSDSAKVDENSDAEKLRGLIEDMESKIQDIKERYPYNKLKILTNSEFSEEYKNSLNDKLEEYEKEKSLYEEKISKLIL